jgi:acyl dehydratase
VSFAPDAIGRTSSGPPYEVTEEALAAYAAATDDVPGGPVFAVVPAMAAIVLASKSVASDEARARVVHYEQDLVVHRPLEPGMAVVATASPVALLPRPNGTSLVIGVATRTDDGELVNEQHVTEFFRGITASETIGERAPDHALDVDGRPPLATVSYPIAEDQTVRYANASGDHFAIHLDDDFARAVGLPGRIVHGLCTMALTGRAVLEASGIDDPHALRRLAVRFSAPLFPGDTLTTSVWEQSGDGAYGFTAAGSDGNPVIKDGRAELR